MIAKFVNGDGTIRKVWVRLTNEEKTACKYAHIRAWFSFFKCPAYFMSEELESIVCGHTEERYVDLKEWPDYR